MIGDGDCGEICGMKIGRGTEVLGENLPQRHFVHNKSHMTRPGLNPGRRGGKPATNCLNYGAARISSLLYNDHEGRTEYNFGGNDHVFFKPQSGKYLRNILSYEVLLINSQYLNWNWTEYKSEAIPLFQLTRYYFFVSLFL
jgi:hypothetical protein